VTGAGAASKMQPGRLDQFGMTISALCLIHCLLLPVAAALTPLVARSLALPEWVHLALLSAALPIAIAALGAGWRQHRRSGIAVVGLLGLALLGGGIAAHEGWLGGTDGAWLDPVLTSIGALLLGGAHLLNWRLRRPGTSG
jgi:hypothetical protein